MLNAYTIQEWTKRTMYENNYTYSTLMNMYNIEVLGC